MSLRSKLVCQDKSSSQVMGFEFKIWTRTRLVDTLVEVIIFLKSTQLLAATSSGKSDPSDSDEMIGRGKQIVSADWWLCFCTQVKFTVELMVRVVQTS